MNGTYDPVGVTLSVFIAILASYTALDMAARVLVERGRRRAGWLSGGSIVMGIGIWSMHFVGMLAFRLPVPVAYDIPLTVLSAVIAILASGMAFLIVSRGEISRLTLAAASVLAGLGISGMHYTGMAAMRLPARLSYDPLLVLASIVIAVAAAGIALWIVFRLGSEAAHGMGLQKMAGGVVLGFAISGMHYTAMAAANFAESGAPMPRLEGGLLETPDLTGVVVIFAIGILSLALVAASGHRKRRTIQATILESVTDAFIGLDHEWCFTYVNAEAERILGCSRTELMGRSVLQEFPEGVGSTLERECRRALTEEETVQFEEYWPARDRWLEFRAFPSNYGLAIYFQDVTARKRALERSLELAREQARRGEAEAARERVTNILESITDRFFALDREWRFTYVNGNAEAFFGKPREQLVGKPIWGLFPEAEDGPFHRQYRRVLAEGEPVTFEAESDIAPGRWLEEHIYPSEEGLSIYSRDVTERYRAEQRVRESEERFRAFTEQGTEIVTVLDPEGKILYESPSMESRLGYTQEELTGVSVFSLIHPEDVGRVTQTFNSVLETPGESLSVELRFRHRDGSWRILQSQGRNLLDHPAVRGIVVTSRDVTEKRELEEKLLQSQKMEAVGQLAGGIAHDFNNLLTSIQGHTRLLLEQLGEDASLREDAQQIAHAAERATSLTRQLLAFSRREIVRPIPLELNGVVLEMEGMLRRLVSAGLDFTVDVAEDPAWMTADATQIQQVILNLTVNASDATEDGGSIRISSRTVELSGEQAGATGQPLGDLEPGSYTVLVVEDTGHGMDEETVERIFEPFFTTKGQGRGTGLGLSTVYGIVKQSGGGIRVETSPEEGSAFRVYFPRAEDIGEQTPAPERIQPSPEREASAITILVAEDEPGVRSMVRKVLAREGYHVIEADNGRTALAAAEAYDRPIDVVLTDIVMPEMGGRELVGRLKRVRPEAIAIYMSGYTQDEVVKRGIAVDQLPFLAKPFGPSELLSKVREVLARPTS